MDALLDQATRSVRRAFDECRSAIADGVLIGYAVYCDDSAISIAHVAASERGASEFSGGSREDFLFNPENWDVRHGLDHLEGLSDEIYRIYEASEDYENNPAWHQQHRDRVFALMVAVLRELEGEHYFGTGAARDEIFVIAWVMDSEVPRERCSRVVGPAEPTDGPSTVRRLVVCD